MREFVTRLGIVLILIFLAVILWWQPAHAEPTQPPRACVSSEKLVHNLEGEGVNVWLIEGLSAVRLLSIVNHMKPSTDYHAEAVLTVFPPVGAVMTMNLVNSGCVEDTSITLPIKVAIAVMRETFGQGDVQPFGRREITRIHDVWTNGVVVPPWVKSACCGPEDVHLLAPEQVHNMPDGIHVDGLSTIIPYSKVLPSLDGKYWGFWNPNVKDPIVYCFFQPVEGF